MSSKDPQDEYNKSKALSDRVGNKYGRDSDINRPLQGQREQEKRKAASGKEDSSCWVATAYFNDPYHADVETLRALRSRLRNNSVYRPAINTLDNVYHTIGRSKLGQKWAQLTRDKENFSIPRYTSGLIVRVLLKLANKKNY